MRSQRAKQELEEGKYNGSLSRIYGCPEKESESRAARISRAVGAFESLYGKDQDVAVFSAP